MFLASGWSSVARNGGGVNCADGGSGGGGGSTVEGSSTSKNCPSHRKYKSPKQFEMQQSWKALRALNARWALPFYPVFVDEKSKASDKKSAKRKIAPKRPTGLIKLLQTSFESN